MGEVPDAGGAVLPENHGVSTPHPRREEMTTEQPYKVAKDTWVIPELFPAPMVGNLYINTMVITGEQPVIVDTGSALVREQWLEKVWSVVEPADVRWIFISHDDGDHVGNLLP